MIFEIFITHDERRKVQAHLLDGVQMVAMDGLVAQVSEPRLRQRMAAGWGRATKQKKFGLMFEDHLPELLPLHGEKSRKGDWMCRKKGPLKAAWQGKHCEPTCFAVVVEQITVDEWLVTACPRGRWTAYPSTTTYNTGARARKYNNGYVNSND